MKVIKQKIISAVIGLSLCFTIPFAQLPLTETVANTAYAYAAQIVAPSISVKSSGYEGLTVTWNKVSGAKSYQVYRSTSKSGTYKKVASISKTNYTDKKVEQNKNYYYKVKALSGNAKSSFSTAKKGKINTVVSLSSIPSYKGSPYTTVNQNKPKFSKRMLNADSYEYYPNLDSLGRCGITIACVGRDLMPTEDRGSIGMIKPSGWHTVRYDDLVDGKYLYNRCHLIGYQLTGENANEKNLVTGTRYLNVTGMLPFENEVADYVKSSGNHVLYRVTPVFKGSDLVCRGIQMEAYSVEDNGKGVCFNVFCYNVQPGIKITYSTGDSSRSSSGTTIDTGKGDTNNSSQTSSKKYVLNTNTKKFHLVSCSSAKSIKSQNRKETKESRASIINQGYEPCKRCNP